MRKLLLRWGINVVGVYVAMRLVSGIRAEGDWTVYLWVGLLLGLANAIIAPVLKALTCPLILLTLGLFTLVINGLMLWLVSAVAPSLGIAFTLDGFGAAFLGALVISVVSFILSIVTGVNREDK